jgi:hypothetical protein
MTTKVQRVMLWGALFLFALLGGSFLGHFVVAGLAGGGKMLAGDNAAATFWQQQDKARNAGALAPATNMASAQGGAGAHVCEGCDASSLHLRQSGDQAVHYEPSTADDPVGSAAQPPTPPTTSAHP